MRTVQAVVESALETTRRETTRLTVAGRTDAGVHARGQVASHDGEAGSVDALNSLLPPDIRVLATQAAPVGFDARRDASSRTYRYRMFIRGAMSPFERRYAMHVPRELDFDVLDAVRVAPHVTRRIEGGPEGVELIAFGPRHEGDGGLDPEFWTD